MYVRDEGTWRATTPRRHATGVARATLAIAGAALVAGAACSGADSAEADENLGGLVVAPSTEPAPIDVGAAAEAPAELARALALPHRSLGAALGAHRVKGTSRVTITEGTTIVDELADETSIALAADGSYRAALSNSAGYGREVMFSGGLLYLRPKYGKFHRRAPTSDDEPAELRDQIFASVADYFDLVAHAAAPTRSAGGTVAGRDALSIDIGRAARARKPTEETTPQRLWRRDVAVRDVSGQVSLDRASGVPLTVTFDAELTFTRDGRTFVMKLSATHEVTDVGGDITIEVPVEADVVDTMTRARDTDDREQLLHGIAPPAPKAPTPSNPTGRAAPAGPKSEP